MVMMNKGRRKMMILMMNMIIIKKGRRKVIMMMSSPPVSWQPDAATYLNGCFQNVLMISDEVMVDE